MPTEKQIEAAAKAICKARYGHLRGYIGREQFYEEEARAALRVNGPKATILKFKPRAA